MSGYLVNTLGGPALSGIDLKYGTDVPLLRTGVSAATQPGQPRRQRVQAPERKHAPAFCSWRKMRAIGLSGWTIGWARPKARDEDTDDGATDISDSAGMAHPRTLRMLAQ